MEIPVDVKEFKSIAAELIDQNVSFESVKTDDGITIKTIGKDENGFDAKFAFRDLADEFIKKMSGKGLSFIKHGDFSQYVRVYRGALINDRG